MSWWWESRFICWPVCGCEQLTNRTADGSAMLNDARECRWPACLRFPMQPGIEGMGTGAHQEQHRSVTGPWNGPAGGQRKEDCERTAPHRKQSVMARERGVET